MIEIECFQREPSCEIHVMKIWINGMQVFAHEFTTSYELISWRDALSNELLWMNAYLHERGMEND